MSLQKKHKEWSEKKMIIDTDKKRPLFHERQIWFCSLGQNIGDEQNGTGKDFLRPVIIIRKFNKRFVLGIPITRKSKYGFYYFSITVRGVKNTAILSQVRPLDSKRFKYLIGKISKRDFITIKEKLKRFFA